MNRKTLTSRIAKAGAIAIVRIKETLTLEPAAEALVRGGITVLEVTCTTPNALPTIEALRQCYGTDILIGAGSVITEQQVKDVVSAGACFVVSPVTKKSVIDAAHSFDLPVLPGALTPTEAQVADDLGADMVKIFPAGQLGFSYVKALLAPLPHLKLVPTGGVTPENAGKWIRSGAAAVGIGSALVDVAAIRSGQLSVLTERAFVLCASIAEARR